MSWVARNFELSLELRHSSQAGTTATLSLGGSLSRDPRRGRVQLTRPGPANDGRALARVYLDRNANDRFDAEDQPIPGASFLGNARWKATKTDADGQAFLQGVPANRLHDVRIDPASIVDPYWILAVSGYSVVTHPGGRVELDFPVRLVGEIDGMVYLDRDGELWPRPNVKLELVDSHDAVVQTIRSSFDGYFLFEGVFPGHYRIRVAENAIRDPGIAADELALELPADGEVVSGLELVLRTRGTVQPEPKAEPRRAAKPRQIGEPDLQIEDKPRGPICGPLARMLLQRSAWAPRGSREVGECLRTRRQQAQKANEPATGAAKILEPPSEAREDRDDEDLTEPPLETTHAPRSNHEAPETDLWMGIFDLRAGSPLAHEQIIIALADTVEGRERLTTLPEQPASDRAERAEFAHHRQARSDRALTRSWVVPPAPPPCREGSHEREILRRSTPPKNADFRESSTFAR